LLQCRPRKNTIIGPSEHECVENEDEGERHIHEKGLEKADAEIPGHERRQHGQQPGLKQHSMQDPNRDAFVNSAGYALQDGIES
jgi:hypothetical protein